MVGARGGNYTSNLRACAGLSREEHVKEHKNMQLKKAWFLLTPVALDISQFCNDEKKSVILYRTESLRCDVSPPT